jgi:hypothetical protein
MYSVTEDSSTHHKHKSTYAAPSGYTIYLEVVQW